MPIASLFRDVVHFFVCREVGQDLDVWSYKRYIEKPILAKGDGPIGIYRRWAAQFYSMPSGEKRMAS